MTNYFNMKPNRVNMLIAERVMGYEVEEDPNGLNYTYNPAPHSNREHKLTCLGTLFSTDHAACCQAESRIYGGDKEIAYGLELVSLLKDLWNWDPTNFVHVVGHESPRVRCAAMLKMLDQEDEA